MCCELVVARRSELGRVGIAPLQMPEAPEFLSIRRGKSLNATHQVIEIGSNRGRRRSFHLARHRVDQLFEGRDLAHKPRD